MVYGITRNGECIGLEEDKLTKLLMGREQDEGGCISRSFQPCDSYDEYACAGKANYVYLYKIPYNGK